MAYTSDGGPAFPVPVGVVERPGMSLRDWFAGQAISSEQVSRAYHGTPDVLAQYAYQIADAMLAARALNPMGE